MIKNNEKTIKTSGRAGPTKNLARPARKKSLLGRVGSPGRAARFEACFIASHRFA